MVVITHKGLAQRFAWGKNSSHAKLPIVSFPPIIRRRLLHHLAPSFLSRLEEKLCLTLFGVSCAGWRLNTLLDDVCFANLSPGQGLRLRQ